MVSSPIPLCTPLNRYDTHAKCVDQALEDQLEAALGCVVPWLPSEKPNHNRCQKVMLDNESFGLFRKFMQQIDTYIETKSNCKVPACGTPCQELFVTADIVNKYWNKDRYNLSVHIDPRVKISRHEMAYGLFELLVDVGSSLGLWMGLSFLGLFDEAVACVRRIYQLR